ncbi:MAG: hypothetical protein IJX39_09540 [Clostridia bacterium]|nr:hypothetical protein [Clostridia bacterium]
MAPKARKDESGRSAAEEMRRLLAERIPEAVAFLVEIMRDQDQKPELRMKAAESILDRACGKATTAQSAEAPPAPPATVFFEGVLDEWSR